MVRIRSTRRRLLALGSAVALAGCTDSQSDGDETDDEGAEEVTDGGAESGPNSSADETATENGGESDSTEIEPESVTFESADGSDVAASVYGDGSCVIVLIPQINMEKESWDDQARALAEDGHLAVPIDPGERRVDAVSGVVTGLREERTVDRVILVGASIGGEAALLAAADEIDVDGVVAISPRWRRRPKRRDRRVVTADRRGGGRRSVRLGDRARLRRGDRTQAVADGRGKRTRTAPVRLRGGIGGNDEGGRVRRSGLSRRVTTV